MPVTVDRANVQSLVQGFYRCPCSQKLLFSFPDAHRGRAFLNAIRGCVSFGPVADSPPYCNVALTAGGLALLRPDWPLASLDPGFRDPPDPVLLGDKAGSSSDHSGWWNGAFTGDQVHCLVTVHQFSETALEGIRDRIVNAADAAGVVELNPAAQTADGRLAGHTLGGSKLHFGYVDGLSSPQIDWDDSGADGLSDLRHFLLGYRSEQVHTSPMPAALAEAVRDSSYLVFRWIYQNAAAFERFLTAAATEHYPDMALADAREFVAAKLMGRWRDGTPLALSPGAPNASLARQPFDYSGDADGHRCPFSAHIRVMNPRDQPLSAVAAPDGVPRVIRRGIPYGKPYHGDPGGIAGDDGVDRGVLGMFICASIQFQFHTLMRWGGSNTFSPVFKGDWTAQDPIVGNRMLFKDRPVSIRIPGPRPVRLTGLPDFLTTKGTLFCLLPSRQTLERICTP